MDEPNSRLCSCFFSSPQFVPSVGGPWLNTRWRRQRPPPKRAAFFVHTSGLHPYQAYTPQRFTERRSRRIHIRDLDCSNPHQVAGPQYFSMDLDDALAAVRPDTLSEPRGPPVWPRAPSLPGADLGTEPPNIDALPLDDPVLQDDCRRPLAGRAGGADVRAGDHLGNSRCTWSFFSLGTGACDRAGNSRSPWFCFLPLEPVQHRTLEFVDKPGQGQVIV